MGLRFFKEKREDLSCVHVVCNGKNSFFPVFETTNCRLECAEENLKNE
jgi:hypothetical protein